MQVVIVSDLIMGLIGFDKVGVGLIFKMVPEKFRKGDRGFKKVAKN